MAGIREEAAAALEESGGMWTNAVAAKLFRAESAIRETLRYTGLERMTLLRHVISHNGVTLPDGNHLPNGTAVGVPSAAIHRDEKFYPNPDEYDAFRFVTAAKAKENMVRASGAMPEGKLSTPLTSDTFLPFSHGRGAW